jgi:hypothetical protein
MTCEPSQLVAQFALEVDARKAALGKKVLLTSVLLTSWWKHGTVECRSECEA